VFTQQLIRRENKNNNANHTKVQKSIKYSKNSEIVIFKESEYESKTIDGVWEVIAFEKFVKK